MTDRPAESPWLKLVGGLLVSASLIFTSAAFAQEESDSDEDEDEIEEVDEVIVTGSRIKRDSYTSISPLQIISGQISREVGLLDAGAILQESAQAAGQQIDLTFGGFVLDDGPGQTNINLRGFGGNRTLVLINGRRVAPGGVEGAPSTPDLGLIPSSLVQTYDVLLDGASSIYGSDAVAGVVNVIMRKDFDGLELEGFTSIPEARGGVQTTMRAAWGKNFDRGFIGIGAEHTNQDNITFDQREWTAGCERNLELDENGAVRSQELWYPTQRNMPWDDCRYDFGDEQSTAFGWGPRGSSLDSEFFEFLYYTPGETNTGIPNWSDWAEFGLIDLDEDGVNDINFRDYVNSDQKGFQDLIGERETTAVTAYGEYTFAGEMNITPFFEVNWAERKSFINSGQAPFFPDIPAGNPFNPCNPNQPNGVDCRQAQAELYGNEVFNAEFLQLPLSNFFNVAGSPFEDFTVEEGCPLLGLPGAACTSLNFIQATGRGVGFEEGPLPIIQHVLHVRGDRNNADVKLPQTRVVAGITGDLPMINFGSVRDWSFEVSTTFSKSEGRSVRRGIRGDRADLALGWYSPTDTPCGVGRTIDPRNGQPFEELASDAIRGCTPVDLFAPSLLETVVNSEFATEAERNYLFGERIFDTSYEQSFITGFLTGELFELPAGTMTAAVGYEYRHDALDSIPNEVASRGLFFGFSVDEGATGEKDVEEFFGEVEIPLLAGVTAAEELTLNMSARYTDDEFYGGEWTESVKLGWRPVDNVLIRATSGSAFRAPGLRELFLAGQTGFNVIGDPCYVPQSAIDEFTDEYDPDLDQRDPNLLANCRAQGVDPTVAGGTGITTYGTEIKSGGALDLFAEESDSWTAGFVWETPGNAFDLAIGATYYEIEISNSIIEPSTAFLISDCYFSVTGNSPFCSRLPRDLSDPVNPRITLVDAGFINRDTESARGVDVNLTFSDQFTFNKRPIDIVFDVRANRQLERSTLFVDSVTGARDFNDFAGEPGFPTWRGRSFIRLEYDDWAVNWETNYIGSQAPDAEFFEDNQFDNTTTRSSTCLGEAAGDVNCRNIGSLPNYFQHAMSVFYRADDWTIGFGVRNVFNEGPPQVDFTAGSYLTQRNNTPLGYGYDVNGRRFFMNFEYRFTDLF